MKLRTPHILLASSNTNRLLNNIEHIISKKSKASIIKEVNRNVAQLYELGVEHFRFAESQAVGQWRQKVSRFYYAAYSFSRAIRLSHDGVFSTEVGDHQQIGSLPDTFPSHATYSNKLKTLREDRNLADYSHDSKESDLVIGVNDTQSVVESLMKDAKSYLCSRGVRL